MENGLSTADALLLGQNGMGGANSWIWILMFFFLFGGNGFGGTSRMQEVEGIATRDAVHSGFQYNQIDNGIRGIQSGLCDGFYATQGAIKDCCCQTNRNIDSVRYDMSRGFCDVVTASNLNTRDILEAQTANTQRILDHLCESEKQALRDRISGLELSATIQNQSSNLLAALLPTPRPAYVVQSPYTTCGVQSTGCGQTSYCGYPYPYAI